MPTKPIKNCFINIQNTYTQHAIQCAVHYSVFMHRNSINELHVSFGKLAYSYITFTYTIEK